MKRFVSFAITFAVLAGVFSVGVSAGVIYDWNKTLIEREFTQIFSFRHSYINHGNDNFLYGYSHSDILRTYEDYKWKSYDARVTLSFDDDDLNDSQRYVGFTYRLRTPTADLPEEKVPCIKFFYDVEKRAFVLLSGEGYYYNDGDTLIAEVSMEADTDGESLQSFGISVSSGQIRCFYEGTLIFDHKDPASGNAPAPFIFINGGNFVMICGITITTSEYLYPRDLTGDGKVNLSDVTALMKGIAKWDGYSDKRCDTDDDGEVNLVDAMWLMQYIAGWYDVEIRTEAW